MLFYRTKNKKYFRGYGFLSFARKLSKKYGKQLLDTATKSGINASKKVIHKATERTYEFLGNKIVEAVAKTYDKL